MSFEDLPTDWAERPVTDPEITADVLDLIVRDADRVAGSVVAVIGNAAGRVVQPVVVELPPEGVGPGEHRRFFDVVCRGIASASGDGDRFGILAAVARSGPPFVSGDDRQWHDAAARSCADHGVRLWGTWLVTRSVIRRIDGIDEIDEMDAGTAQERSA